MSDLLTSNSCREVFVILWWSDLESWHP